MSENDGTDAVALPDSAVLAWWATAWLRGHEGTDHVLDAITGADAIHTSATEDGPTASLLDALLDVRGAGVDGVGLALPVDGDLLGLGGPARFNGAALETGEAAVAGGLGLVPERVGASVLWRVRPAARRQLPDVGEADRALRSGLLAAADALAALDVARWRPEVADRLMNARHLTPPTAPAGTPPRCVELAARGLWAIGIADLALEDDGGAISAQEIAARRAALEPLSRAGRRALVAACSPEVWPPT